MHSERKQTSGCLKWGKENVGRGDWDGTQGNFWG
jgi:hypothetical protein